MSEITLALMRPTPDLETLIAKTRAFISGAKSPATVRAYRSDFADFVLFCQQHQLEYLPATPTTVALYITDRASTLHASTITRRLTAITKAHQAASCSDSPASTHHFIVGETLKGIRRAIGTAQVGKKPLLTADILAILAHCPDTLLGIRDQALILAGFAGSFRRSEIAAINFQDISFTQEGMIIDQRHSKVDQESRGRKIAIPFGKEQSSCPVLAVRKWIKTAVYRSAGITAVFSDDYRVLATQPPHRPQPRQEAMDHQRRPPLSEAAAKDRQS
jgi:site-specific recombinase XerC